MPRGTRDWVLILSEPSVSVDLRLLTRDGPKIQAAIKGFFERPRFRPGPDTRDNSVKHCIMLLSWCPFVGTKAEPGGIGLHSNPEKPNDLY